MKIITGRSAIGKLLFVAGFTAVLGGIALTGGRQRTLASAFGPTPSFTNAPGESNCTACHIDSPVNSGDGSVQIMGVPATYTAGQQISITVVATQGNAVVYGFQLTAVNEAGQGAGNFTLPSQSPARTKIVTGLVGGFQRRYVEHTSDGLSNGQFGFNSWTFTWTAPAQSAGKVDFYVASNSANSDGPTTGH